VDPNHLSEPWLIYGKESVASNRRMMAAKALQECRRRLVRTTPGTGAPRRLQAFVDTVGGGSSNEGGDLPRRRHRRRYAAAPVPARGQVLVKTLACGICGSDLHAAKHAHRMVAVTKAHSGPRADGPVARCRVRSRILLRGSGLRPRHRPQGEAGSRAFSAMPLMMEVDGPKGMGYSNTYVGGYAEQNAARRTYLARSAQRPVDGPCRAHEPLAVGVHAVREGAIKGDGGAAGWWAAGLVGLAVIAALRLKGIRPIVAADFSPKRRELAVKMGADIVVDPAQESPYVKLDPAKRAAIFECVGVPGVLQQMFEKVPRDARVVVVGVCMEPDTIEPCSAS